MRFAIVSANFPPEPLVAGRVSLDIARGLRERGHEVVVLTPFPSRPQGQLYRGYRRRLFLRQEEYGIEVVRCFSTVSRRSTVLSRALENLSFGATAFLAVLGGSRLNAIYSDTWPLFATWLLWFAACLRRVPVVLSIQDAFPESLVAQGRIRASSPAVWITRWIDGLVARRSAALIAISYNLDRLCREGRGVAPERISMIPLWVDGRAVVPDDGRSREVRTRCGIPADAFLIVYAGSLGVPASVETVIESMRYLSTLQDLYLLVAGSGPRLQTCQRLAREIEPHRIRFYTPLPAAEESMVLSAANVLVLSTKGGQSLASMPSKLITYLLSGRPVIALAAPASDLARVVRDSRCGWVVEPDRPASLAEQIRRVKQVDPTELRRCGQVGRTLALQTMTREICMPRLCDLLEQVASPHCAPKAEDYPSSLPV